MSKIVLALGGNALGNSPEEQLELVAHTAISIVDLIEDGNHVIIVHGNGPQVGMINLGMNLASEINKNVPSIPLTECGAMSQGYIGYHLQNAIGNELKKRSIKKNVSTLVTQVIVDPEDMAFKNPEKFVGSFYTKEEAEAMKREKAYSMVEDSGRGYRRVVASPKPVEVVEKEIINELYKKGHIIIACGGGGIPVIEEDGYLKGIDAVIDKDLAAGKLSEIVDADIFIVLTAVNKVAINFAKEDQRDLDEITVKEAYRLIEEGHFPPGSMLPKILACIEFANSKDGRVARIGSLENAKKVLDGKDGTSIRK